MATPAIKLVPVSEPESKNPPTQEEAEAKLHQEGYESYCWHDVSGTLYPRHQHAYDECLWILKGEITFETKEAAFALKPGDRLYMPAGTAHSAKVTSKQGVTYLVGQKTPEQP
ncbi:MAG: cupin domain-containing protein [Bdellovibrionota bacterium]